MTTPHHRECRSQNVEFVTLFAHAKTNHLSGVHVVLTLDSTVPRSPLSADAILFPDPCELGDDFLAKQPPKTWNKGNGSQKSKHPFQYRADSALQGLAVSTPHSFKGGIKELLRSKETTRWIFTPSFNRFLPGPRQALLDRSEALPKPLDGLDVGPRYEHDRDA